MNPAFTLQGLVAVSALAWILYGPWQRVWSDYTRQTLFEVRDTLLRLAQSGELSFEDPTYIGVRSWINTMIRYAPAVSVFRSVAHHLFARGTEARDPRRLVTITSDTVQTEVFAMIDRCEAALALMAVLRSPLLWLLLLLAVPIALVVLPVVGARRFMRVAINIFAQAVESDANGCALIS